MFQESLYVYDSIGDIKGKALSLKLMGHILLQKGDIETGLAYLKESIEIFERIGSPEAEKVKGIMAEVMRNRLNQDFQD